MTTWTPQQLAGKLSGSPYKLHYRTTFQDLPISIENRVGSKRKWGPKPEQFTRMKLPYGYIRGAEGYDGDEVDVFIGPNKKSEFVFIVNQRQRRSLGKFDEHKVMLGFDSMPAARKGYLDHYDDIGTQLIGSIRMWTMARFKKWLAEARATKGPVRKSLADALAAEPKLVLRKAGAGPFVGRGGFFIPLVKATPSGYSPIPGGKKGGFRKRKGKGWTYWYPDQEKPKPRFAWGESKWSEKEFHDGNFDKDPNHWRPYQIKPGHPPIGGRAGGVHFDSWHPVKEAGYHQLYRIKNVDHDQGWAILDDVNTGAERHVALDRVLPVFHEIPKAKPRKVEGEPWDPSARPDDPDTAKPSGKAHRIQKFDQSRAKPGTGLASIEAGVFLRYTAKGYELDASGESIRVETVKTHVDNQTKEKLIAEFARMLSKAAKDVKQEFGLKSQWQTEMGARRTDETLVELRMSAIEGLLVGMEQYEGDRPFAMVAKQYARDYARLHAATEFAGGVAVPRRVARMLSGFVAARIQTAQALGVDSPTPKQIAKFWDLRKRNVHSKMLKDDPQYNEPVPLKSYKLKVKTIETDVKGKRSKVTTATGIETHVGRLVWAERIHSFLTGQKTAQGSDFFEGNNALFPGLHMGVAMTPREKVDIRASVRDALADLTNHEISIQTGRQMTHYRADSQAIVMKMLGLEERTDRYSYESVSVEMVAEEVRIERKHKGAWKSMSARHKVSMVQTFFDRALDTLKQKLNRDDKTEAARVIGRAQARTAPEERARPGMTYRQVLKIRAREVTKSQIQAWRAKERGRMRRMRTRALRHAEPLKGEAKKHQLALARAPEEALRRIDRMNNQEISLKIAHSRSGETSEAIRRMQLKTITVEGQSPGHDYGWMVVNMTDPRTGRTRRVRMRTATKERGGMAGEPLKKADDAPINEETLNSMLRWPRLTALLWGRESIPTTARFQLETLVGLH